MDEEALKLVKTLRADTVNMREIELKRLEEMQIQDKRRAEEIQLQKEEMYMQLNMKELERLSKDKEQSVCGVISFDYASTSDLFHIFGKKKWTTILTILRKLPKVWFGSMNTGPYFYRVS